MDLNQFTILGVDGGDLDLRCARCPGQAEIASTWGVLGNVKQLPHEVTLTALLKAATQHDAEAHRG